MNETQALQEELNRLHAAFTVHKQETERTITMLEILIACLLAANIRADVRTEAECARLLNQLEDKNPENGTDLDFIDDIMLAASRT